MTPTEILSRTDCKIGMTFLGSQEVLEFELALGVNMDLLDDVTELREGSGFRKPMEFELGLFMLKGV